MQPLSPSAMAETLELLTPDMQALVVEANIKNNSAGPIATAWEAALLRAIRMTPGKNSSDGKLVEGSAKQNPDGTPSTPSTPHRSKNFWEKEVVEEVTVPAIVSEPHSPQPLVKKRSDLGSSLVRQASFGGRSGDL